MSKHMNAPIALFVYNRPMHTRLTVEALQKNAPATDSDLFIFSDAPKIESHETAVREVRQYIRQIDGFRSITILERKTNFGLARSIIDGVTTLCREHGRLIVLEDDLVTSPHFLRFMNDALEMYEHDDRVMHVSGATYPIEPMKEETFFLRIPLCWGWATWDRAWRHFRKGNDIMLEFDPVMRSGFTFNGSYDTWEQLEANRCGLIDSWFVYWYATLFLKQGLALFPGRSLVKNIGMDGTGVHCGVSNLYDMVPSATAIQAKRIAPEESAEAVLRHEKYFRKLYTLRPTAPGGIVRRMRNVVARLVRAVRSGQPGKK